MDLGLKVAWSILFNISLDAGSMMDISFWPIDVSANALLRNDDAQTSLDVSRINGYVNVVRTIEVCSKAVKILFPFFFIFLPDPFCVLDDYLRAKILFLFCWCLESYLPFLWLVAGVAWSRLSQSISSSVVVKKNVCIMSICLFVKHFISVLPSNFHCIILVMLSHCWMTYLSLMQGATLMWILCFSSQTL